MDSEKLYRVQEEDLSKLEELLCRSFAADPLYVELIPDEEVRKRLMPELFQCDLTEFYETCEIFADSKDLNGILVVSDETEPYHLLHRYFTEVQATLRTEGYLIREDHSLKTFFNFVLGRDYLNSSWTDQLHQDRRLHIIYLASTILLFSCSREADVAYELPAHTTRAQLSIDLVNNGDVEQQEKINSMRFIVFGSTPGGVRLDVNEHILLSTPETATDIDAQLLEVTSSNDILVVVIANEPQSLTSQLDGIANLLTLQEMIYDISSILNSDGQIISATGMPMTGVIRDISIAPDETKTVQMVIERAVARVDVFIEAIDGGAVTGYTAGSTSVTLHNFSHDSYFVMGNVGNGTRDNADSSKNYGKVKEDVSESNLLTHSWTAATTETWAYSSAPGAENRKLLCSFYTAERLFKSDYSDRLSISMANVLKGPSDVTGITGKVIESVTKVDGTGSPTAQPFTEIRRNNVYQVTARVGKIGIQILTISVEDWGERQDIDLDMDL